MNGLMLASIAAGRFTYMSPYIPYKVSRTVRACTIQCSFLTVYDCQFLVLLRTRWVCGVALHWLQTMSCAGFTDSI